MRPMPSSARIRTTATARSEQVMRASVTAFARSGFAAINTDEIARLASTLGARRASPGTSRATNE